jgi:predicted enzyme related to lactoylglutathione lyase
MLTGLNGATIWSEDNQTLVAFYRDILGLNLLMLEADGFAVFGDDMNRGWLGIGTHSEVRGSTSDPHRHMIALGTSEIQADYSRLRDLGVEFIEQPTDYGDGFWVATLKDPEGNLVQLFQNRS